MSFSAHAGRPESTQISVKLPYCCHSSLRCCSATCEYSASLRLCCPASTALPQELTPSKLLHKKKFFITE